MYLHATLDLSASGAFSMPEPNMHRGSRPSAAEWIADCAYFNTPQGHRIAYWTEGAGPDLVLLHGFPTWSYDYAEARSDLARDHRVIGLDFLGYGASDKPRRHDYSVTASADAVEALLTRLGIGRATLVIHDYGGIVGQELLDRDRAGRLSFRIDGVHLLNCGIVYAAYRPTRAQRALATPLIGPIVARGLTKARVRAGLDAVRGVKLTDADFEQLWVGMARDNGHTLAHRHIRYNAERARHHQRWEDALAAYQGPLHFIWGMDDPVSGARVLAAAQERYPWATVTALNGIGHFPQAEAPEAVAAAIRATHTR